MAWTQDKKDAVIQEYTDTMANEYDTDESRALNSMEVVEELAVKYEEAVNGTRAILSRAGVYIKKSAVAPAAKAAGGTAAAGTSKRVNKAEAIQALKDVIVMLSNNDPAALENEILDKLTGKAAMYFTGVLQPLVGE